ncbi:signal peptidase I [Prevotella sp. 10(H)]|uniref:signal peptidase I n=1 Tax=Prevotella sp. 10(H) TaxID=1158294 RepID=UPI0004A7405A|nr:signal peptidase I [Prevotella sp. 10(H)]
MSSKKKNIYIHLGKVVLITLLVVLVIRCFFIESFSVSSTQMESTLQKGDKILINKTAYGVRLPITLLSIPFVFDNIFGVKSYSSAIQIPYKRIGGNPVSRNDIVLFNNPLEVSKPLDKRSLLLSRCVALPGDMIEFNNGAFNINGQVYTPSSHSLEEYHFNAAAKKDIEDLAEKLQLNVVPLQSKNDSMFVQMSKYDAFVLNGSLSDTLTLIPLRKDSLHNYTFPVPSKGTVISLTGQNLILYESAIMQELVKERAVIDNGKLLIKGVEQKEYTFTDDYYWMLSDNTVNSTDSRSVGFVPFKSVIGKAWFVWYKADKDETGRERFLSAVE